MNQTSFKIEGKEFWADLNLSQQKSFTIKSVPRPYSVEWVENDPSDLINQLLLENPQNILLIDRNILNLYHNSLKINESKTFICDATEEFKTIKGVLELIDFLEENKFTKAEKLIAVGGGIVQDVAAFVGACYKRGICWYYFPTTLLSMCDSCIGGKTGINHHHSKNQLALFSAPSKIIINPSFLKTLNHREIQSGLGEILKLNVTGGPLFLEIYEKNIQDALLNKFNAYKPLIYSALSVKKAIVEEDEFELYHRKALNYGHTLGHAVEALSNYKISHGIGVSIGMILINEISSKRSLLSTFEKKYLEKLAFQLLDPSIIQQMNHMTSEKLGALLQKDKKTMGQSVHFVVIQTAGETKFLPLPLNAELLSEINGFICDKFKK